MQTKLNPYLSFKDNAAEAMAFYKEVFGGEVTTFHFKDMPMPDMDPAEGDKVMHSQLTSPTGIVFMAADTPAALPYQPGHNISMSLSGDNEAELRGYFDKLAAGGTVAMPLDKAPWGDIFGMVSDQFGIDWMINIADQPAVEA